jgi:hypothetical protein
MCDWVNDDLPYTFVTKAGTIVSIPFNHELSDRQMIGVQQQSIDSMAEQVKDAFEWLSVEASRYGGRVLPLTPYIIGLPYRMDVFENLLAWLSNQPEAWFATAGEIVDNWSSSET